MKAMRTNTSKEPGHAVPAALTSREKDNFPLSPVKLLLLKLAPLRETKTPERPPPLLSLTFRETQTHRREEPVVRPAS